MTIESVNRKESTSVPWNLRTVAEAAGDSVVAAAVAEEAEAAEVADHDLQLIPCSSAVAAQEVLRQPVRTWAVAPAVSLEASVPHHLSCAD